MNRPPRLAALALSLTTAIAVGLGPQGAAHSTPANTAPANTAPATAAGDFYTPPSTLPATNGALVRSEPMRLGVSFDLGGRTTSLPGRATRLLYRSTDAAGQPVAVSGTYIEPTRRWNGSGPRPFVSFSVGTQGVGDACAPSKTLESFIHTEDGKFMVGYEVPSIYGFLNDGVAVVVTDYVGLGTTDRVHTYMNRLDQAHAVLDAARAALALPDTSITAKSPIGLYGYSQGGGASGAAAELAPSYAPELNLRGAYVGGPPANLFEVMKKADGTLLTGVIPWTINAIFPYRPDLAPLLDRLVNARGLEYLRTSQDQCVADAILATGLKDSSQWTRSGNRAAVDVAKSAELLGAVADQRIGRLRPAIPVQVLTGTQDDIVEHTQAKQLAVDWCAQGANVTYKPVFQLASSGGLMLTHLGPLLTQQASARAWLVDRLEGRSVRSNCSQVAFLP